MERDVVLVIADISGYTQFMVANKKALSHAHVVIAELIKTVIHHVEIPLEVAKLEGDAVFMYALRTSDEQAWEEAKRAIGSKLLVFFDAFNARVNELSHTYCPCEACNSIHRLALKAVVHSGKALFYTIGKFEELSSVDVITAHRLLKNDVPANEYLLMTAEGYAALDLPKDVVVTKGAVACEGIGTIETYVHYPKGAPADEPGPPRRSPIRAFGNTLRMMFAAFPWELGLRKRPKYRNLPETGA